LLPIIKKREILKTSKGTTPQDKNQKKKKQKMKIQNALNKLNKAGFTISENGNRFSASKPNSKKVIEFLRNGRSEEIACVGFRNINDVSDSQIDYCATIFCDSLNQAMRHVA
jgi:hypothetical protein